MLKACSFKRSADRHNWAKTQDCKKVAQGYCTADTQAILTGTSIRHVETKRCTRWWSYPDYSRPGEKQRQAEDVKLGKGRLGEAEGLDDGEEAGGGSG